MEKLSFRYESSFRHPHEQVKLYGVRTYHIGQHGNRGCDEEKSRIEVKIEI